MHTHSQACVLECVCVFDALTSDTVSSAAAVAGIVLHTANITR